MAKQKFYSLKAILSRNAEYNLIYGERSNGKSYAVKMHVLKKFRDKRTKFVYIRRYDRDIQVSLVNAYFSDMPISEIFDGEFNMIYVHGGNIYLAFLDENGNRKNVTQCGCVRALNMAQRYSSTSYPDYEDIILEEFISLDGSYLSNELFLFNHIISTVARRRNITVWLIANSISRISPYWREFGVDEIVKNQKQGEIVTIQRETDGGVQLIAIEYCKTSGGASKMFNKLRGEMTNSGKWLTHKFPRLDFDVEESEVLYLMVIEYKNFKFLATYRTHKGNYFIYVEPKTTEVKSKTRLITDRYSVAPLTTYGFKALTAKERLVIELFFNGKCFFADDQTGTEFQECVKNLKMLNF